MTVIDKLRTPSQPPLLACPAPRRPTWIAQIFLTGAFRFYPQIHTILTVKEMAWAARAKLPGSAKNMGVCYILEILET